MSGFFFFKKKIFTNNRNKLFNKGYKILEVGIQHKKRKFGNTKIFHFWALPSIALNNFIGMLRVKLDLIKN